MVIMVSLHSSFQVSKPDPLSRSLSTHGPSPQKAPNPEDLQRQNNETVIVIVIIRVGNKCMVTWRDLQRLVQYGCVMVDPGRWWWWCCY